MKIILTAISPSIDSNVDQRFGRGAYFLIVDPDTLEWQAQPNPGVGAPGGAGTLAAQFASNQNVSSVISGDFGPNAYNALQAAGIAMYLFGASTTVRRPSNTSRQDSSHELARRPARDTTGEGNG